MYMATLSGKSYLLNNPTTDLIGILDTARTSS